MTKDKPRSATKYTCNDRREEMILLGLKQQLNSTDLSEIERKKLKEEIAKLEKEFGF